ncbi:unnamed protein product [Trifolium pratense]|uniref:Uncharacterized protein n=1 Tax=Trifolium pratense TaxID=57577 RepID=A0ACB0JYA0_TRIPR|nr:unnamed protein product [Trifolium pratense]
MVKVHELRQKTKADLKAQLKDLKAELSLLRVAKVTDGAPNKLSKIKVVRLSIAQVFTVLCSGFSLVIVEILASLKTEREKKMETYFPLRKYAIKA